MRAMPTQHRLLGVMDTYLDGAEVNEEVGRAVLGGDEAVALLVVEPLDGAVLALGGGVHFCGCFWGLVRVVLGSGDFLGEVVVGGRKVRCPPTLSTTFSLPQNCSATPLCAWVSCSSFALNRTFAGASRGGWMFVRGMLKSMSNGVELIDCLESDVHEHTYYSITAKVGSSSPRFFQSIRVVIWRSRMRVVFSTFYRMRMATFVFFECKALNRSGDDSNS